MPLLHRLVETLRPIVGIAGVLAFALCIWAFVDITSGPGDDNPVAMVALVLAGASVWPASGLFWARRARAWARLLWLLTSLPILAVVAAVAWQVLTF